ncbi:hypothetical protein J6590_084497 [Homalodisca vitripennis]|nr:hypothetical protein J6590_084497 [Homalodisca vitripennis]
MLEDLCSSSGTPSKQQHDPVGTGLGVFVWGVRTAWEGLLVDANGCYPVPAASWLTKAATCSVKLSTIPSKAVHLTGTVRIGLGLKQLRSKRLAFEGLERFFSYTLCGLC